MMRVEVHDDDEDIREIGCRLSVCDEGAVVDGEEAQPAVVATRRVFAADAVQQRDQRLEAPGGVQVPMANLVLLRVPVILRARERVADAELEGRTVDPVAAHQRGGEDQPDLERRAAARLEVLVQDVGRVREEVRSHVLADRGLRELGEVLGQLRLRVAPGEVGVRLREARLEIGRASYREGALKSAVAAGGFSNLDKSSSL